MLPSSRRLTTALFSKVMAGGKSLHSPFFVFRALKSEPSLTRFSVSVPKKVGKTAVLRNKVRRQVYSGLRTLLPQVKSNIQGVFIVKTAILDASYEEISAELRNFFVKSGLLK